jgi:hypothetical protein
MINNKIYFSYLGLLLGCLVSLVGCVGTVQESSPPGSLELANPPSEFVFNGITTARGISHNKVELEFFNAPGGSEINYFLYLNNSIAPIPIDPQSLTQSSGGKFLYTIDGLEANREYKFKITAKNSLTAAISKNENEAFARTFDNIVANFNGVSKLSLLPGDTSGSIRVDWIAPGMSGIFLAGRYDPSNYEITIISEIGGFANINNPVYNGADKWVRYEPTLPARASPLSNPNTKVITNLLPNTRYYIQVRAINTLYQNYVENPATTTIPVDRERNTKFLSIRTDPSGNDFDFRQDNIVLANAPGSDAFDKIDIYWQPGKGAFTGYHIFVRKYDGLGDPVIDDKLTEAALQIMNQSGEFVDVTPGLTNKRVSGLENAGYYQVKIVLCKTITCPVVSSDPNVGIISDLKTIQIRPTLAPFSGINNIEPPGQYLTKDVVNLRFDAPYLGGGYANLLEFYCVNPANKSQMVLFDGTNPISGSGIASCENLYLDGLVPSIGSHTNQRVRGLNTSGTKEYCFAATPAIIGFGSADVRIPPASRIVRCSYPEVLPPSISQFPGLKGTCSADAITGSVSWNLPTGGVYSGFKVYWKEKIDNNKFFYPNAVAANSGYFSSTELSAATTSYDATNLMPGKTYQIGVLATVNFDAPAIDLYSEYNLNILECVVPLPIPTFKGFTRIFAVGPKYDGKIPNDPATKAPPTTAAMFEALDSKGQPFEVAMDSSVAPNVSANFTAPPGRDFGVTFAGGFDGIPNVAPGYAMSNQGVISLAWEDVAMSFTEADTLFNANQPTAPALRTARKWGYKVFRSNDNKLTWKELTTTSGLIYSSPYSYYKRPNDATATTARMAFFTDYSVKSLSEVHDATNKMDIERARNYYYKIVPIFDGQSLVFASTKNHIVRVTLPPPNMALVHRWMANRARCLELDKSSDITKNYTCPYNGIGAKPNGIPYQVGQTYLDQAGDLLIDRQELGCRYTRGDKVTDPETGSSNFNLPVADKRDPNDNNFYPLFRGYRTSGMAEDASTNFKGCVGKYSNNLGNGTASDYQAGFAAEYNRYLQGDCLGGHAERIAIGTCTSLQYADSNYSKILITTPGVRTLSDAEDCSAGTATWPKDMLNRLMGFWAPNAIMQSEFLAVFYNTDMGSPTSSDRGVPIQGPATGSLATSRTLNTAWESTIGTSQCSVNLAAIDGSGFMKPRWVSVNELGGKYLQFKNSSSNSLLSKTVAELTEVAASTVEPLTFYNGVDGDLTAATWKLPTANLRNSQRYRDTTQIGRVMTSNAAKLPPLGRMTSDIAEALCSNYWVQTGIASDTGNFAPDTQPLNKRPLRRIESVTASAWSETYDTTAIQALEKSTNAGSCNNKVKVINGTNLPKGAVLNNISSTAFGNTFVPMVTGSSGYNQLSSNVEPNHTANCVSRYGIQDLVGNVSEINSERIFCDYSQDVINLGPTTALWSGGAQAENQGDGGPDIPFFNTHAQRSDWAVLKLGKYAGQPAEYGGAPAQFEIRYDDASPKRTDYKPWVKISVDSGYCSIVDSTPSKRSGGTNFFKDALTNIWSPFYLPGGAINTNIIEKTQKDQEGAFTWRTGDGRFLDFGPKGIGAALNKSNTLALSDGGVSGVTATDWSAQSKYFNPIIGLPLNCSDASCNDPALNGATNDNTSITTPFLAANLLPGVDDSPTISDFPVGNSQITHVGLSEYTFAASGFTSAVVPTNGGTSTLSNYSFLVSVTVDDPITMLNPRQQVKQVSDFTPGDTIDFYRVIWSVDRGAIFGITSGGGASISQTGRYSASIKETYSGSGDLSSGSRCAVMINQDQ